MQASKDIIRRETALSIAERKVHNLDQFSRTTNKINYQQGRSEKGQIPQEFIKAKPPTFDGENKKAEEVKAQLLGMNKYFIVHQRKGDVFE